MKISTLAGALGVAAAACLCGSAALAGPPYAVNDPGTPEYRHYEVNLTYSSSQVRGSEAQAPYVEANYGYNDKVQLTVGSGIASVRDSGTGRITGLGDSHLEVKWRFQEEGKHTLPLAVHYILKVPTAGTSQGLGTGRVDHAVELITGKSLGRYTLFGNVGYNWLEAPGQEDSAYYGAAGTYQLTEKLVVGVQGYGNTPTEPGGPSELAYGVGATYDVMPDRTVLLAIGRSARGLSDLNVVAGFQWVLGPRAAGKGGDRP